MLELCRRSFFPDVSVLGTGTLDQRHHAEPGDRCERPADDHHQRCQLREQALYRADLDRATELPCAERADHLREQHAGADVHQRDHASRQLDRARGQSRQPVFEHFRLPSRGANGTGTLDQRHHAEPGDRCERPADDHHQRCQLREQALYRADLDRATELPCAERADHLREQHAGADVHQRDHASRQLDRARGQSRQPVFEHFRLPSRGALI